MTPQNTCNTLDTDVFIVGAGLVGLSLALMLSQQLMPKRIIVTDTRLGKSNEHHTDKKNYQRDLDHRVTALSAGGAALLATLGIWDDIQSSACAIQQVKVSDHGMWGYTDFKQKDNQNQPLGWVIENRILGQALQNAVQQQSNIELISGAEVKSLKLLKSSAQISFKDDEKYRPIHSSLVVIADGENSRLAQSLGVESCQYNYQQYAVVANVAHSLPHEGCAYEHFSGGGPLAFLPLPSVNGQYRSAIVWTHALDGESKLDSIDAFKILTDDAFSRRLEQQFSHRLGRILAVGKRDIYPLRLTQAKEQIRSRIVLVGNAAHSLHPVAGQGFNLSLRDCSALVEHLCQGLQAGRRLGHLHDLMAYQSARALDQAATISLSHQFIKVFSDANIAKKVARNAALTSLNTVEPIKHSFFKQMMGQGVMGQGVMGHRVTKLS